MIHSIQGKITYKYDKSLILENQGIGFKVFCAPNTSKKISQDKEVKLFTHLHLKEDVIELYGFLTPEELGLFETLNTISGIGPKTATLLASLGSLEKLKETIEKSQLPPEIKGIGAKKMQKILLELTGKIKERETPKSGGAADNALSALTSLGFPQGKAREALSRVQEATSEEERIRKALKILGGR